MRTGPRTRGVALLAWLTAVLAVIPAPGMLPFPAHDPRSDGAIGIAPAFAHGAGPPGPRGNVGLPDAASGCGHAGPDATPPCDSGPFAGPDPASAIGNSSPVAEVGTLIATVPTDPGPAQALYDPVYGYTYVANQRANSVTVFDGPRIVATAAAGTGPYSMALDPRSGEVYVGNTGSNNLSVLAGAQVVTTVTTAFDTSAIVFDPGHGYVYAASNTAGSVEVIENRTVIGAVQVGSLPKAFAYDNATGQVYLANEGSANVSVLDGGRLAGTIAVGSFPESLAFDPVNGNVYVANYVDDTVSVLHGTSVLATLGVGASPIGVVVNPRSGEVYVCGSGNQSLAVLSGTSVVRWIPLVDGPTGAMFDPANGLIYVTSVNGGSITAVNGTAVLRTIPLRSGAEGAAYDARHGDIIVPDFSDNNVSVVSTLLAEAGLQQTPGGDPNASIDVGQPVTFQTRLWAIGTGNDSITWATTPSEGLDCGPSVQANRFAGQLYLSLGCAPTRAGGYTLWINASDSNGSQVWAFAGIEVFPPPDAGRPRASLGTIANAASADVMQRFVISASPSNGTGRYLRFTWSGLPPGACGGGNGPNVSCVVARPVNLSIAVTVVDSNGGSASSPPIGFRVLPLPDAGVPTASRASVDVGQPVTFSTGPSGGSGNYAYHWFGLPAGCAPANASHPTCLAELPGALLVACTVTDSNQGNSTLSPTVSVTVFSDPFAAAPLVVPNEITIGASVVLRGSALGGSGGYSYAWEGLPPGCNGTGPVIDCRPTGIGSFLPRIVVTDTNGYEAVSNASTLEIAPERPPSILAGPTGWYLAGAGIVGIAVAVVAVGRRWRRRPPPAAPPD